MALGGGGAARAAVLGGLLMVGTSTVTASARAQPAAATQSDQDRRNTLYRAGVEAATAGRWAEARDRFAAALAIRASPKVYFSLAQTEERLGDSAAARRDYGRALEGARATGENDVVAAAQQALSALPPAPSAATPPPAAPASESHEAPSSPPATTAQAVTAPSPPPTAPSPGPPPATSTDAASTRGLPWRPIAIGVAGLGVVGLGLGTYFGLHAKSEYDQSNTAGCNGDACTSGAASIRRDAVSAGNVSTVLFVLGGVLTAGGVTLWLLAPRPSDDTGVTVGTTASAGSVGVVLSGGWR